MSFSFNFNSPLSQGEGDNSSSSEIVSNEDNNKLSKPTPIQSASHEEPSKEMYISEQHVEDMDELSISECLVLPGSGQRLGYVDADSVQAWICKHGTVYGKTSNLGPALLQKSDLIPQVYEGGLKIWECSVDLVRFLLSDHVEFRDRKVLELGCGAGLPGIFAHSQGAAVDFQDYNWEVIDFITITNVLLNTVFTHILDDEKKQQSDESSDSDETEDDENKDNENEDNGHQTLNYQMTSSNNEQFKSPLPPKKRRKYSANKCDKSVNKSKKHEEVSSQSSITEHSDAMMDSNCAKDIDNEKTKDLDDDHATLENLNSVKSACRFFSGDWTHFADLLENKNEKYDYILTSETIYSTASYSKLHTCLKRLLKPSGCVYLAAKTYYFGCGGGTRSWEEFVRKQGVFNITLGTIFTVGLKREILKMTFKCDHHTDGKSAVFQKPSQSASQSKLVTITALHSSSSSSKASSSDASLDAVRQQLGLTSSDDLNDVIPLESCPHLDSVVEIPSRGLHVSDPCKDCGMTGENWVCLVCYQVHCSRNVNEHMLLHGVEMEHRMVLSYADLSVWCYACDSYVQNQVLLPAKRAGSISKYSKMCQDTDT